MISGSADSSLVCIRLGFEWNEKKLIVFFFFVDSIAKTKDAGCRPYMAPERIDPEFSHKGYDVRSDVWSLGITLMEVATGKFPYQSKWASVFEQLYQVVQGDAPRLTRDYEGMDFSEEFCNFVNTW